MKTVIEMIEFTKQADKIWSEDERLSFIDFISQNPTSGDVIKGAEGARKVRWAVKGSGKSGGVRVIYFNLEADGTVLLIAIYKKSDRSTMTGQQIKQQL